MNLAQGFSGSTATSSLSSSPAKANATQSSEPLELPKELIVIDMPENDSKTAYTNQLLRTDSLQAKPSTNQFSRDSLREFFIQLDLAKEQRRQKNTALARKTLAGLLESYAPLEIKRTALLELAAVAQDEGRLARAVQILAQFLRRFPEDPNVPEVMLRQGILYREMGVNELAISKFYAVMTSALTLKLETFDYYRHLVLQAQTEIADTYYLEGRLNEAADFLNRLLNLNAQELDKEQIHFKLIRALSSLDSHTQTISQAKQFLDQYPHTEEVPEVRFLLARAFKQQGQNNKALQQVLELLESQQAKAADHPSHWIYWQQRAGNDIANQLYKEGDYVSALEIYLSLAKLNSSPLWQVPVFYQIGLVHERLGQNQKASQIYDRIVELKTDLSDNKAGPALNAITDMAAWRRD